MIILIKIIISFLLTLLPLAVLIRDWKFNDKRTKKHHNMTRSIVIFWCLGSLAATYLAWNDLVQIDKLSKIIKDWKQSENLKLRKHNEKLQTVATRTEKILLEGDLFLFSFLSNHKAADLHKTLREKILNEQKITYSEDEILNQLKKIFVSSNMLEPSPLFDNTNKPFSELEYLYMQMGKIFFETESILQHYGGLDHDLIKILDDIRNRSMVLYQMIPLLKNVQGGVEAVFGNGVPDSWANLFSHYYLTHFKCRILCNKILKSNNPAMK